MIRRTRLGVLIALTAGVMIAAPTSAPAAVTIGETFVPDIGCGGANGTWLQTTDPTAGPSWKAPAAGVITSWSWQAAGVDETLRLKVARPAGTDLFTTIGRSDSGTVTAGTLGTFQTRISVQPGDVIGLLHGSGGLCADNQTQGGAGGVIHFFVPGNPGVGETNVYTPSAATFKLDVSAQLEPDADNDGFGDETQDACPSIASTQLECVPPDTTITQPPPAKTKKKAVTIGFTSNEAGSIFECSLDGGPFAACTSPATISISVGTHTVAIRAKDAVGNIDPTPATTTFKRKKKKKK